MINNLIGSMRIENLIGHTIYWVSRNSVITHVSTWETKKQENLVVLQAYSKRIIVQKILLTQKSKGL